MSIESLIQVWKECELAREATKKIEEIADRLEEELRVMKENMDKEDKDV